MTKIGRHLYGALVGLTLLGSAPANAGNIFLTGHDPDFHQSDSASAALTAALNFVRNGSTLPVLVFDNNSLQLDNFLTTLGIAHTTVNPSTTFANSVFDITKYSAFAVASQASCGGCDLSASDVANIATHATGIASFFNAGGGIAGLTAGFDPNGYAYVPEAAANAGGFPPTNGFVETLAGTSNGLLPENGDATHNFFPTPGTSGLSSSYQVAETNGGSVESIFLKGGSISCEGVSCTIGTGAVPEPSTWAMILMGFGAMGGAMRRRKRVSLQIA